MRQQELRSCQRIGYEFYCEELFIVKHKSSYSCESAIYFNLTTDIIKNNCDFDFYFNKTVVIPTVLDGGDEIVLANWPNDKHMICNINNDIPIKIPSHAMFWLIEVYYIIVEYKQITIIYWNLLLHVIIRLPNWLCISPLT